LRSVSQPLLLSDATRPQGTKPRIQLHLPPLIPLLSPERPREQPLEPRNLEPRNLEPRSLEPRNLEPRNLEPRNLEPRNQILNQEKYVIHNRDNSPDSVAVGSRNRLYPWWSAAYPACDRHRAGDRSTDHRKPGCIERGEAGDCVGAVCRPRFAASQGMNLPALRRHQDESKAVTVVAIGRHMGLARG
jgi:hypothetical protein